MLVKNKIFGGITFPNYITYTKLQLSRQHENRPINQWNKIYNVEINPYIYGQF